MKNKLLLIIFAILILIAISLSIHNQRNYIPVGQTNKQDTDDTNLLDSDDEAPPAIPVSLTPNDLRNIPADTSALGGYNVLIADRGNNRLIEVTPDKQIVWEYKFNLPKLGLGADDSFFADGGKSVIVNLEEYHLIQIIDYVSKNVIWSYGVGGKPGSAPGMLNTPDDAYKLPNGNITVADIKNCRVLEISPDKKIVRQYGQIGVCRDANGFLDKPNGDTPLPNGHTFISNIVGRNLVELDANWQPVFTIPFPVAYPSDPQPTKAGNILISDYSSPGQIVEMDRSGKVVWQFSGQAGDVKLNKPSLAEELPNGNIICNDDLNHRVIIIDKKTKKIIWQYGVTDKPGSGVDQLNVPDGLDIIMRNEPTLGSQSSVNILTIGEVSRHPQSYINQQVTVSGYVLEKQNDYVIFSDESTGSVGVFDLPVVGAGVSGLNLKQKYTLTGILKDQGLSATNHNPDHLEVQSIQGS